MRGFSVAALNGDVAQNVRERTVQRIKDGDLDILVEPTSETTMMDIGAIRYELKELLGIPVDVLTPRALPDHFRGTVLREAVAV